MIQSNGSFVMRRTKDISFEAGTVYGASFLFVFLFFATVPFPSQSAAAKPLKIKPEMVQEQLAARVACQNADAELRRAIATASSDFSTVSRSLHHFPRNDSELIEALRKVQALAEKNPYMKEKLLTPQISSQFGEGCAIGSVTADLSLTETKARDLQRFPPQEWQAYPGSICIVHNGANIFLVWAAGFDGKPLHSNTNSGIALESRQVIFR
jgi:hypothetical protein